MHEPIQEAAKGPSGSQSTLPSNKMDCAHFFEDSRDCENTPRAVQLHLPLCFVWAGCLVLREVTNTLTRAVNSVSNIHLVIGPYFWRTLGIAGQRGAGGADFPKSPPRCRWC